MASENNSQRGTLMAVFVVGIVATIVVGIFAPMAGIAVGAVALVVGAFLSLGAVSGRDEAERQRQRAVASQQTLQFASPLSIIEFDSSGTVVEANKAAERLLGFSQSEFRGKKILDLHVEPELAEWANELSLPVGPAVLTKTATEAGIFESEWTYVRKDGSKVPVSVTIAPLKGTANYVAISNDLSTSSETEAKLAHYVAQMDETREELAQKNRVLEEIAEELKASRDEAVNATNTKSEFLANMSHEIRTPLNGVLGTTHLLLATELDEKQKSYVQLIHRSSESLLGILNDILDLSKMEAGKMTLEQAEFDLRETIEDVCEQFAPIAHQKGLELNVIIPPDATVQVLGDPTRIRQVFTNLVANAIKFTDKGEVDVNATIVREDAGTIRYKFGVRDTGIGIPSDRVGQIFESFTQADGNTARRFGGTGLGLAISRQLVELMHGQIGVTSVHHQGSEFWFEVAFQKQDAEKIEAEKKDLGGITVLVADDNETSLEAVKVLLESWNCNVITAADGREASDLLAKESFDCAVLDMLMPVQTGLEIAKATRKSKRTRDLPIVLISAAHALPSDKESDSVFQAILSKPVRSSQFYSAVSKAVKIGVQETSDPDAPATERTLADVRVLVVEDNPINQLVVTELLKGWGCTVVAVDNGRKAVDRLAVDLFDIILMDMQMPEMDGLEATRAIRSREKGTEKHIPIIAMTANAMKGDEEKCLESGMDAYLSKPIQPAKLAERMGHYVGHEVTIQPEVVEEAPAAQEGLPVFDLEQLNQTTSGKPELQQRVLERYLESLGPNTAKLDDSVKLLDRAQIRTVAHSLKGSSWTVGALAMADIFRRMEAGAESLSKGALEDLVVEAEQAVEVARQTISDYLREATAPQ